MKVEMSVYGYILFLFLCWDSTFALTQGKPVLIRDEVNKKDKEEEQIRVHDPEQARKSVSIGDFYLKKGNLKAAAARYTEAIDFNLRWFTAYEKLIKLLESEERYDEAIEICDRFVAENPESKDLGKIEKLRRRLEPHLAAAGTAPEP